ncbi:MAG: isopeptide-forming domain-containing fimbrial protein [Lachnospiraceae bacterium]|nr:isopeptide-forming domain-containing fimbrial protein [Lachnospiraceae bacterium]
MTNTYKPGETTVKVTKKWEDTNNKEGLRPKSIKVELRNNSPVGTDGEQLFKTISWTLDADQNWTHTFTGLPTVRGGQEITYTLVEVDVPKEDEDGDGIIDNDKGYTVKYDGQGTAEVVITNSREVKEFDIPVWKEWNDADANGVENADGRRPKSIRVNLVREDKPDEIVDTIELKDSTDPKWYNEFKDVQAYENGEEIIYNVVEVRETGNILLYTVDYKRVDENDISKGVTIINTYEPKPVRVAVEKKWEDEGLELERPDSVTVHLLANGGEAFYSDGTTKVEALVLSEANGWKGVFENLPAAKNDRAISYTVKEERVVNYKTEIRESRVDIEENGETVSVEGFVITNTRTPDEETVKTVNGKKEVELTNRNADINYSISTKIPVRDGLETELDSFRIEDELNPVLEYKNGNGGVIVKVDGHALNNNEVVHDDVTVVRFEGQKLIVTIPQRFLTEEHQGVTPVQVDFIAKIRPEITPEQLAAYVTTEGTEDGSFTIPNKATAIIDVPNGYKEIPSEIVRLTPPEYDITKKVDGGTHKTLDDRTAPFTYTIETTVAEKKGLTKFVITDELEKDANGLPVVVFADTNVDVSLPGADVNVDEENGILTVTYEGDMTQYMGKPVTITFRAKLNEDPAVDFSKYEAGEDGPLVPNEASYTSYINDVPEDPEPSDPVTVTPPDPEIDKMIEQPDGSLEDNLTLPERYASIPYVITTKMPVRSNMTKFVVTDALEPVLQVKDGETVSVLLGGEEVGQATANVPVPEEGKSQVITVTFDKDNGFTEQKTVNGETIDVIKAAYQGKDIVVRFNATVRPGVNLAKYIEGETVIIRNFAKYNISIPTRDLPDEWSEETRVTPPESTIEKTVDGGLHKDLTNRDDPFTYEIVTAIPEKDGVTSFVIEDTLASVLTFDGRVIVTVDGKQENSAANTNGQLLRVTVPERYLGKDEYKNAPVVIRFDAKIKDDATVDDLKGFLVDAEGNPTGTAKIPNTAKYIINNNDPKESNEVTVTPPEPEIEKEANGQKDPQLVGRYEEIVYTINTELPIRNDLESFVITDQLADALTFADDPEVKVTPEGATFSTDNDTLTVTFTGDALNNNIGQKVQVSFKAKIKEDLSGIDMTQYTKNGPAEIPNQATYHYEFPDKPATKPEPSNEIIITPKDPEITKIVDGPDPQHKILSDRFENAHYTLTTELPIRDDMNRFVIEDIIEPELQFVGTNGGAIVKIGGNDVTTQVTVKTEGTDTLQVIIGDKALLRDNMGKAVTVEFDARIRDNAQLADHISAKYERGDAATASGKVEVPNIGRYFIYLNGNNNRPRRLSPASAQTQADASKESNTVYITPPDPKPEKTVNGGTHLDLVRPDQAIPYTITSRMPERTGLEYFVLTDTIEDVLQFVDGSVNATLGGQNVTNLVRISGQTLTLRLDGQYVAREYQGQPVQISFSAQFKKGADLSEYVTVNYAVPNEATQEFRTPNDNPKEKSDIVTVTPPPEIEKEVKGAPQATIENRREEIPYTINTSIPLHDGVTSFVVTDVVEPVLDIVNGSVKVTVDGQEVTGAASVQGQTLTVNITDAALLAQKNAKVQISFTAKIREGADLSGYRVNNTDTVEIPNKASYRYAFDGKVFVDTTEDVIVRLDPEMISIPVEKIWEDDNNRDNVRPQSITVRVTSDAPGFTARTLTLAQANSWKGTFTDLPRYRITGEKITYTVTEDAVANYTTAVTTTEDTLGSVNGATITNTHTPGRTDVSVVKVWAGDAGVARPASITIRLQANGRATGQTLTLNAANGWSGSFRDLHINENGQAITYTVTEDTVANYTTTITANGTYAYTVTNTYNTPPVPPEDPPANPPEEPEVLGATRVRTTDTPEVLGARRGKTGDEFDPMQHMMYLLFAASACVLFALSDGKKKEEEQ